MAQYASKTSVSPEKTLGEIQAALKKYGASKFGYFSEEIKTVLAFEMLNRRIRFNLPLPLRKEFDTYKNGRWPSDKQITERHDQAIRQRWRALLLAIKAKLESVESGIETFEEAFMAHIVLPGGQTMGEWATPQIAYAYSENKMPPLLGHDE